MTILYRTHFIIAPGADEVESQQKFYIKLYSYCKDIANYYYYKKTVAP